MISAVRELGGRPRRDVAAVAQDGDRVGDRADLLEPVADEDDRDAALAQPADGREEVVDLVRRERGGRLVHDQQPRARRERLRDLEQLPVGDAEPAHRRVRAEVDAELVEDARRLARASRPSRPCASALRGCAPGEDVLGDASGPGRPSAPGTWRRCPSRCAACGSPIRCGSPSISDLALVGLDDAGEDLDERRLARAVLADERVHGRRLDREADVRERLDAAVALRDAAQLDERGATACSSRVGGGDAAVDVDDVAGRLRRARPGEEGDRLGDVLGVDVDAELRAAAVEGRAARPRLTP